MANKIVSSCFSKPTSPKEVQLLVCGVPFALDMDLLAARSAKVSSLLRVNPRETLLYLLQDIPAEPETFELVARFCHGFELNLSTENVIPLICVASYLEMNESHSSDNLIGMTTTFFAKRVLPSWNETIKAFRSVGGILPHAVKLGLIDLCVESLVEKALADPRLLGEPIKSLECREDSEDEEVAEQYRPNARRRLFVLDWKSEDLATLPLHLYEPSISSMNLRGVQPGYVAASLCLYAQKWVFSGGAAAEGVPIYKRNSQRDVIEAVERLLPHGKGLIPCTLLFELLRSAILLECSSACRNGYEIRIGKQLDQATVKDLLIPSQGYAKEVQYDIECLRRILKHYYSNFCSPHIDGLLAVAEVVEEFLIEVASDIDLKMDTFVSLADMSVAASLGTHRNSDGLYRAIDVYLDKHRYLTEQEREEVCRVLDCQKMSPEAWEHAAKNERLPMRFVLRVLFITQLQMRKTITKEVKALDGNMRRDHAEEGVQSELKMYLEEQAARTEMEKMSIKIKELERECCVMRKEIENGGSNHKKRKGKVSMWKEMKRKLGCMSSIHDCNSQVKKKKVHPKIQA